MRKLSLLLSMAAVAMSVLFTSCSDDESVDAIGPSVALLSGEASQTVLPGATINYTLNVEAGDARVENLTFRVDGNSLASTRFWIDGVQATTDGFYDLGGQTGVENYVLTIMALSTEDVENIVISAVDRDEETASSLTLTITTEPEATSTPLEATLTGQVFHVEGNGLGSYDLLSNEAISSIADNDAMRDIMNTDEINEFTGSFTGQTGDNGTTFIASTLDPMTATQEEVVAAYMAGTASDVVMNPSVDDIYIFATRRDGVLRPGILWITALDEQDGTNDGSLSFSYKLAAE